MAGSRGQEFLDDRMDQSNGEGFSDASPSQTPSISPIRAENSSGESDRVLREQDLLRNEAGLTNRLTDVLVNDGDGDLLLQCSDREDRVLQWLQALDMQVVGACRADERLRPLLKVNVSNGMAEDCLLAHLSQYFEPVEVGILARCFCIPLVSMRVGRTNKQGSLMCPTNIRGNLSLTLLPTSCLRLSFLEDSGQTERLFTFSSNAQCRAAVIREIPADNSGRSFVIKVPDGRELYYWCCEKSKLLGIELLSKMKDLIRRKPSVAELTGIDESRLGCFASHFRFYLMGSAAANTHLSSSALSVDSSSDLRVASETASISLKSLRSRQSGTHTKSYSFYQGSLSPRSSSFKEGTAKNSSSRIVRDKLRWLGDSHLSAIETTGTSAAANASNFTQMDAQAGPDVNNDPFALVPESRWEFTASLATGLGSHLSSISPPIFAPYYCWCPLGKSALHQCSESAPLPKELPSMPPLSSLLPGTPSPSLFASTSPIDLADIPPLNLSPLLQDPLLRFPISSSQQIPTFTPLMCDPIVHVPVIDICSSGQGYLVSAGPAISAAIPPLHPNLTSPVLSESDSLVDKGARDTLRFLIGGSSQTNNSSFMDIFPSAMTRTEERPGVLVTGSRGLYSGAIDVTAIAGGISSMGLVTNPGLPLRSQVAKMCNTQSVSDIVPEGFDASGSEDEELFLREKRGN